MSKIEKSQKSDRLRQESDKALKDQKRGWNAWSGTGAKETDTNLENQKKDRHAWSGTGAKETDTNLENQKKDRHAWDGIGAKETDTNLENQKKDRHAWDGIGAKETDTNLENQKESVSELGAAGDAEQSSLRRRPKLTVSSEKKEEEGLQNSSGEAEKTSDEASKRELARLDEALQKSLKDNLYLRAEFENFKRRTFEEQSKLIRYGGEQFIISLANEVLDDLERAFSSAQRNMDMKNLKAGLSLIQKKLSQVLNNFGIQVIDPTGKAFDPSYQEALSHVKTSRTPEGHVAETFKKAYKLHDKVIRPAQVILAEKEKKA